MPTEPTTQPIHPSTLVYQPLHLKYRPQTFAELVGQEAIATVLTNAVNRGKISPGYLFSGSRGTGKTSTGRILAKSLNCLKGDVPTAEPCSVCEVCQAIANGSALDVIEIDAASNTGVDNIRELIERSQFAPVQCRYKVYLIDECHMLSNAASNALLKTLEEPPDHVVFILATTNPQKVLDTVISRCHRFDFMRIDRFKMVEHLAQIAKAEAIAITNEALELIARVSNGGMRDAQTLLDQISLLGGEQEVTPEQVYQVVGAVPEEDLLAILQELLDGDSQVALGKVVELHRTGKSTALIIEGLGRLLRDLMIAKLDPTCNFHQVGEGAWEQLLELSTQLEMGWIASLARDLRQAEQQIRTANDSHLWLECFVLDWGNVGG